jgi:outer membrane protein TolC
MRSTAAVAFAIVAVIPWSASALSSPLTLRETLRFALENSPTFDSAQKALVARELEYQSAIAKMLPSADLNATQGLQNNIPISSTNTLITPNPAAPWYSSLNLGVTETLYDNGISLTGLKVADLSRDLAAVNLAKARDALSLSVATEFYRYSLATALLEVRRQQQSVLEKQFRTLTSQYHQGFKTRSDFLRLKTQVQRAEIETTNATNGIELSVSELRRLVGAKLDDETPPPEFTAVAIHRERPIEKLIPAAAPPLDAVYDFRISKIQQEINGKSVTLAQRNYWPRVSVTSGLLYSNFNFLNSDVPFNTGNQLSWNALLTIQYNLWDWGTRRRDVQLAEVNRDVQGNSIRQGLLDTRSQLQRLMIDLSRLSRNYQASRELLSLEEESNRNLESQYREGKVAYLDLITSLNSLLDAKVQYYSAYFDTLSGIARHGYFQGKLYDSVLQE